MADNLVLTKKGFEELEKELEYLKNVRRKEVAEHIKEAKSFGDLSENAEYDEARNEQSLLEGQIQTIENQLKIAKVVDDEELDLSKVSIGTKIRLLDVEFNEEETFQLFGTVEADASKGIISNESPIGKAVIGASVGDVVNVEAPVGTIQYKVLSIEKADLHK